MKKDSPLFTEISLEEAAVVSGGYIPVTFDINIYYYILGAAYVFGVSGVTNEEIQFAWESAFVFDYRYALFRRTRRVDSSSYS